MNDYNSYLKRNTEEDPKQFVRQPKPDASGGFWKSLGSVAQKVATPENVANIAMPLLGIAEVIATKGASKGDYALKSQQLINQSIRDKEERQESARDKVLQRKKAEIDIDTALRGIDKADTEKRARERTAELARKLDYGQLTGENVSEEVNHWAREYYAENPEELKTVMQNSTKGKGSMSVAMWENMMSKDPKTITDNEAALNSLLSDGVLTESQYDAYMALNDNNTSYQLKKKIADIIQVGAKERSRTGPMVERQRAMIPGKVQEAGATTEARVTAQDAATQSILSGQDGKTLVPGFKPLSNVRITDDSVKKIKEAQPQIETMRTSIRELLELYKKSGIQITGDEASKMQARVRTIQLLAKSPEFFNLGVLNGPDLDILEGAIPDPTKIRTGISKMYLGDNVQNKLDQLLNLVNTRSTAFYKANGFMPTEFNSVEEAEAANLPPGTEIIVKGKRAVVE